MPKVDSDGDCVPDEYERNGFYYDESQAGNPFHGLVVCNGAGGPVTHPCFKTDPTTWSTDQDQFSDFTEASKINMPPGFRETIFSHPLVAEIPTIGVKTQQYNFVRNGTITTTGGGSVGATFETSTQSTEGWNLTAGVDTKKTGSIQFGYSQSETTTNRESRSKSSQWSEAKARDAGHAADLYFEIDLINRSEQSLFNVTPKLTLSLGGHAFSQRRFAPVKKLEAGQSLPVVFPSGTQRVPLSLAQLISLQMGSTLSTDVVSYTADFGRWDNESKTWVDTGSEEFIANIRQEDVELMVVDCNGRPGRYYVWPGPGSGTKTLLETLQVAQLITGPDRNGIYSITPHTSQEHRPDGAPPRPLTPENWFFNLSKDLAEPGTEVTQAFLTALLSHKVQTAGEGEQTASSMQLICKTPETTPRIEAATLVPIFSKEAKNDWEWPNDGVSESDVTVTFHPTSAPRVKKVELVQLVGLPTPTGLGGPSFRTKLASIPLAQEDGLWTPAPGTHLPPLWLGACYGPTETTVGPLAEFEIFEAAWIEVFTDDSDTPACFTYLSCANPVDFGGHCGTVDVPCCMAKERTNNSPPFPPLTGTTTNTNITTSIAELKKEGVIVDSCPNNLEGQICSKGPFGPNPGIPVCTNGIGNSTPNPIVRETACH